MSRMIPSERLISLPHRCTEPISSAHSIKSSNEAPMAKGISFLTVLGATAIGATAAEQPTMSRVLKMLEPITLPTARSGVPFRADIRLTNSSGAEVPAATMVRPITISGTRMSRASFEAPSVIRSAPQITRMIPTTISPMLNNVIVFSVFIPCR